MPWERNLRRKKGQEIIQTSSNRKRCKGQCKGKDKEMPRESHDMEGIQKQRYLPYVYIFNFHFGRTLRTKALFWDLHLACLMKPLVKAVYFQTLNFDNYFKDLVGQNSGPLTSNSFAESNDSPSQIWFRHVSTHHLNFDGSFWEAHLSELGIWIVAACCEFLAQMKVYVFSVYIIYKVFQKWGYRQKDAENGKSY